MNRLGKWLPAVLLLAACEFRSDLDTDREISIKRTAPPKEGTTGQRSRFGVMLDDSRKKPAELHVFAQIDDEKPVSCSLDQERLSDVDKTDTGYSFWCKVDPFSVSMGPHNVSYWVVNRDDENAAQTAVTFRHDPLGPSVAAKAVADGNNVKVTWSADPGDDDLTEVTVHGNGVRLFSSFARQGSVVIDAKTAGPFELVEVRAYDTLKNESVKVVPLTR